jgi:hypothetical protein
VYVLGAHHRRWYAEPIQDLLATTDDEKNEYPLTRSKLIFMLPTLVAPTGTMPKEPCCHCPSSATRSFDTNRFSTHFATHGETKNSSPARRSPFTHKLAVIRDCHLAHRERHCRCCCRRHRREVRLVHLRFWPLNAEECAKRI